jgi:transposase
MNTQQQQKHRKRKYDASFKADVLRQIEGGRPVTEVAKSVGISEGLIYIWRSSEKQQQSSESDAVVMFRELEQVRAKLRHVEMERDILKKALSIFSRMP